MDGDATSIDFGHWVNNTGLENLDLNNYRGFIYRLHFTDGCTYIGRKFFWNKVRRPPLKGKKRVRISYIESNWRKYRSSSQNVIGRLQKDPDCIRESEIIGVFSSQSALNLAESLGIGLSRVFGGDSRPINERIEAVRGGYKSTEEDERQLRRLIKMVMGDDG